MFFKKPNLLPNPSDKTISHLIGLSSRLGSPNDIICLSVRRLIDSLLLAKNNRDISVVSELIVTVIQSFLEHYRPSFWRDQPRGLEILECTKEAHMVTLRHILSLEQPSFGYAWVAHKVDIVYIH